mmetsp:Transcript_13740/g.26127  ORF Transcript_13740/g.26127 Transcript_13740/m.26127 type:complete len:256 (-) Transcript_13740:132-899(-)
MVLVEELSDDEVEVQKPAKPSEAEATPATASKATTFKPGFLDKEHDPLYPPEGSPEGVVSPDTHKAHTEHKMNENLQDGMNRGAKDNNGIERPPWYTKDWPKDCQYNSPGCTLDAFDTSTHGSELKKQLTRDNNTRWAEATASGQKSMRLSFMSVCDEDVSALVEKLKGNKDIEELDLSHNSIKDQGVQALVAALANGAAPNLRELRMYSNEFGELGQTMLTKGLPVFRKKLEVHWKEPSYAHLGRSEATAPAAA